MKLRQKYLILASTEYDSNRILEVYNKYNYLMDFDIDVAFSCCHVKLKEDNVVIVDPYWKELKDPSIPLKWYMPNGAKVEVNSSLFVAREKLNKLSSTTYDAVINACSMSENGIAEFWYMLELGGINPKSTKMLPMSGLWDEQTIKILLLTLN